MSLRVIEITAPAGYADTLVALADQYEAVEVFAARSADAGPQLTSRERARGENAPGALSAS